MTEKPAKKEQKKTGKKAPAETDENILSGPGVGPLLWFALLMIPLALSIFMAFRPGLEKPHTPAPQQATGTESLQTEQYQSSNVKSVRTRVEGQSTSSGGRSRGR